MALQEKLDAIRAKSKIRVSEENRAIMRSAAEAVARSGQLDRVPREGEAPPDITLPDTEGVPWKIQGSRGQGPLLLVFFRGHW